MDDLYSLGIALGAFENKDGLKSIYIDHDTNQQVSECFNYKSQYCVVMILRNTVNCFPEAQFGNLWWLEVK